MMFQVNLADEIYHKLSTSDNFMSFVFLCYTPVGKAEFRFNIY